MKWTSSPGQSYNCVRIATRAEHTGTTLAFCLATELQRMTHTIARISARTHPNRSRSCRATQDITSGCIGRAWQHTTNKRRFHAHVPANAAHKQARPSPDPADRASAALRQLGPLQLLVVLERGEGELSLRTSNGANHAQHDSTHDLGGSLGRELNGAAPLMIESTRQRRIAHHDQHAVMHGAHIVLEVVEALQHILRTKVQQGMSGNY